MDADRTDEELVAAVRLGDDRAFEALWQRYHRRIAAYVNGMVNDHARAEDITQDVFMSALRRMRDTDRPIAFKPWIYEIAKNACIDAFRRSRRTEEVSYDIEGGLGSADQGRLVSSSPTPDVAVDTRMSLDNLRGAFGGLSETHHDILVMRELEGLSYREIGERLGMSRPSVESTLFRARRRLTEEYEELISGERCRRMQQLIIETAAAALGARDARRMARHVSHCQPCRRAAVAAGLDLAELVPARPLREKIAALLPIPAFLKRRFGGEESGVALASTTHSAQWAASVVGQYVEPAALSGWAKAAAAAATIAVAGVGAGVATDPKGMGFAPKDESLTSGAGQRAAATGGGTAAQRAAAALSAAASSSPDGGSQAAIADRDAGTTAASATGDGGSGGSGTTSADTAGGAGAGAGTQSTTTTSASKPRLPALDLGGSGSGGSGGSSSAGGSSSGSSGGQTTSASSAPALALPALSGGSTGGGSGGGASTPTSGGTGGGGSTGGGTTVPTSGGGSTPPPPSADSANAAVTATQDTTKEVVASAPRAAETTMVETDTAVENIIGG